MSTTAPTTAMKDDTLAARLDILRSPYFSASEQKSFFVCASAIGNSLIVGRKVL